MCADIIIYHENKQEYDNCYADKLYNGELNRLSKSYYKKFNKKYKVYVRQAHPDYWLRCSYTYQKNKDWQLIKKIHEPGGHYYLYNVYDSIHNNPGIIYFKTKKSDQFYDSAMSELRKQKN